MSQFEVLVWYWNHKETPDMTCAGRNRWTREHKPKSSRVSFLIGRLLIFISLSW